MKESSKSERDPEKLASQLDQLRELNPERLREQWQTLFGADPPPKLRSSLMAQAIAYRLQEKALGGLKPATLRLLERIANDTAARRQVSTTPEKICVRAGGLRPNFPPVISRVRRLFRPLLGRVVCGCGLMFIPVFPAALFL